MAYRRTHSSFFSFITIYLNGDTVLLKELFKNIDYKLIKGNNDIDINNLCYDSRKVKSGDLFIALTGLNTDGHNYIEEAVKNGAKAILISKDSKIFDNITIIKVTNTNKILSKLSMNFFKYPQNKIKTIAITGTKGKTTTSFMIKAILENAGYKCGLIGTLGIYVKDKIYKSKNTTPESYEIFKYMNEMVKNNFDFLIMEVSSQALKYDRVNDLIFDYAIFTNLTEDHIGSSEHDNMDDYIKSKAKLFKQCKNSILNIDDKYYNNMINNNINISTFGYNNKADLYITDISFIHDLSHIGIEFKTEGVIKDTFKLSTPGKFSSYNALAAILTCHLLEVKSEIIKKTLLHFHVKGRVEPIKVGDKITLLIDYAHNGISTKSVLSTIRTYNPKRIVTIFGCGGNRSQKRRYEMGYIAGEYSDFCIITEDNNRYEEFEDIAKDILKGISKTRCKYIIIPDRKNAIKYAIENAKAGDVIMLIGKGHEDYKEIKGIRYPFDERIIIKEILSELKK